MLLKWALQHGVGEYADKRDLRIDKGLILEGSIEEFPELKIQAHGICTKFILMLQAFVPINIELQ